MRAHAGASARITESNSLLFGQLPYGFTIFASRGSFHKGAKAWSV